MLTFRIGIKTSFMTHHHHHQQQPLKRPKRLKRPNVNPSGESLLCVSNWPPGQKKNPLMRRKNSSILKLFLASNWINLDDQIKLGEKRARVQNTTICTKNYYIILLFLLKGLLTFFQQAVCRISDLENKIKSLPWVPKIFQMLSTYLGCY